MMKVRFYGQNKQKTQKNYSARYKSKLTEFDGKYGLAGYLLSVLLIIGLLFPLVLFGKPPKVSVQKPAAVNPPPASASAPPEPYIFSDSSLSSPIIFPADIVLSSSVMGSQYLASGYKSVADYVATPPPPEGFAMATVPNFWDRASDDVSSLTSFLVSPFAVSVAAAPAPGVGKFDFDADGKADAARWQASSGEWKIKNSSNGSISSITLATSSTTIIAPADYDGDSKTDYAVLNGSASTWTIKRSSDGATQTITGLGQYGDKVVSGKYDTDAYADAAVFRPSNGTWYVKQSSTGTIVSTAFGASTDIPAPGDYDGDGRMDCAVFRPSAGGFYVLNSSNGSVIFFQWGISTDTPVPADYDNDGKTDFAVYRVSTGTWYVNRSDGNPYIWKTWGNYGDQPAPADYDGDGKADFAVWRPTTGTWYIVKSSVSTLDSYEYHSLGVAGDVPVESVHIKQIGGPVSTYGLAKARLTPRNATGSTNLYSQNFNWGTSLVDLPGRAELDAGFGISYNSLIWTKQYGTMIFDPDNSNVSPGFRFGFPVLEPTYYDLTTGKYAYLMVTPSGGRAEFRQIGASSVYETADSSYAQLKVNAGAGGPNTPTEDLTLTVTGTNGSQMNYVWKAGAFRCSQIKDRNGNYITVNHDQYGLLQSVTDTLGRIINVNYDSQHYPISITQNWQTSNGLGSTTPHTYAAFTYTNTTISSNFGSLGVYGPPNGTMVKVLQKIELADQSYTTFDYNDYGQVHKIVNYARDNSFLNQVRTDLGELGTGAQTDCPRFAKNYSKAANFNLNTSGQPQETVIRNSYTENQTCSVAGLNLPTTRTEVWMENHPNSVISKTCHFPAGNWAEGLAYATEDRADNVQKRWTLTSWTQDDPTLTYILNPRVTETKVGDEANIKRTTVSYHLQSGSTTASLYGLVSEVKIYDANQTTVLKRATTDYNLASAYLDRRIIGLPLESELYDQSDILMSKVTYAYDGGNFSDTDLQQTITPIQHDTTNYGSNFITGIGNLTSTTRCNAATSSTSTCLGEASSSVKYNTAGAAVAQITPGSVISTTQQIKISYADAFNDGINTRNTYAYPTKLTDPANNFSEVKYRFDTGANVRAKSPAPAGNTTGKETARIYDDKGRLERETLVNTGAYTRYEYPASAMQSKVFTIVADTIGDGVDSTDEVMSESWSDGAGRTLRSRTELPNSTGGWTGSLTEYNLLGQVKRASVATEISVSTSTNIWTPSGDDNRGVDGQGNPVWLWTNQEYDWKGRVIRQVNTDGTDKTVAYAGCGCAGGQVTTVKGEEIFETDWQGSSSESLGRRTQKIYADILGRTSKTEVLNWDNSVYSTVKTTFNGRDQAVSVRQYQGADTSSTFQETTMTYDGHGRLVTQHRPEQIKPDASLGYTTYNYNQDDSIASVVDARGASTIYAYNTRGLTEQISYSVPSGSGITVPATINYYYDALGNRTSMTDGYGGTIYAYDSLSRLTSETRTLTNVGAYTFNYTYNLAGQLTSLQDAGESSRNVSYTRDKIGRLTNVGANGFAGATNYATGISYRAFGSVKAMTFGSGKQMTYAYDTRLRLSDYGVSGSVADTQFKYYADDSLKFLDDNQNSTFDRSYKYDHAGRTTQSWTGAKARGETTANSGLYQETFGFNAFGNLTNRTGVIWGTDPGVMVTEYQNNRRTDDYDYDADGRVVAADTLEMKHDAAGRQFWTKNLAQRRRYSSGTVIEQGYDGDGQRVTQSGGSGSYYVRSSALGGAVVYELKIYQSSFYKREGFVYANGQMIATQSSLPGSQPTINYLYTNPITNSKRSNSSVLQSESDPMDNPIGLTQPEPDTSSDGVSDIIAPRFASRGKFDKRHSMCRSRRLEPNCFAR